MISDAQAREQALSPGESFIVEAPAGSGKTGLLVQRYLRLLATVERPESIVAMTFTRKAAGELKERVEQGLQLAGNDALLRDPSRLRILTIDALCAMLTRQMPVLSEFGGIGEVIEDAREMYRLAARRTLGRLSEGGPEAAALFRRVALHFDNDIATVERQVARMLQQREQWSAAGEAEASELVNDFRVLLAEAHATLLEVFRERSCVDFTEVTRAAIRALGAPEQPSDLLYALDFQIQHLLVDEFQDTSRAQYELLQALTEQWSEGDGHTLFLVGDPMQSIYGFREAEVGLFLQCRDEGRLGSVRLTPLRLTANFRSTPAIVEWTQTAFAPLMDRDDALEGAVKLRPAQAAREETAAAPQVIPFVDDDGDRKSVV